jgi:hypothetical protein
MSRKPPTPSQAVKTYARKQRAKDAKDKPKRRRAKLDPVAREQEYQADLERRDQLRLFEGV